jgi:hypothetical protein
MDASLLGIDGMENTSKKKTRSLRNPGQSLDEEIDRVFHDQFLVYYLVAAMLWAFAGTEWLSTVLHARRAPALYALAAVIATALCAMKFVWARRQVRNLRKGRDGEREVAEILDELKRLGATVLHDIPQEKGNVDHVVICRRGIFVIETKNWEKPEKMWEMQFDGERIHADSREPTDAPIRQCKAQAAAIRTLLQESTSKVFPVRGVVVFLGWYIKQLASAKNSDIWVLNPKQLKGWIKHRPVMLSDDEVAMATLHLKQFVKKLAT